MFVRTQRLFIRPIWPEDYHELQRAMADEAIVRNLAHAPWPYTLDDVLFFAAKDQRRAFPQCLILQPEAKDGMRLIGGIGLNDIGGEALLGYWLAPDHWGRGYATEAVRSCLPAIRLLGHTSIGARCFVDNPRSARVLGKLGFVVTGQCVEHSAARCASTPALAMELDLTLGCGGNPDRPRWAAIPSL